VTNTLDVETEAKTEAAGFETEAEAVASETEAEAKAVYLKTEARGSWPILLAVLSFPNH